MTFSTRLACSKRHLGQCQIWNLLQQPRTGNLEHVLVFCPCCHSRSCRRCLGKKRFFFCVNSSVVLETENAPTSSPWKAAEVCNAGSVSESEPLMTRVQTTVALADGRR